MRILEENADVLLNLGVREDFLRIISKKPRRKKLI